MERKNSFYRIGSCVYELTADHDWYRIHKDGAYGVWHLANHYIMEDLMNAEELTFDQAEAILNSPI